MSTNAESRPDRLRVRPNRHALMLAGVIFSVWYTGEVQSNGAAYMLGFLLVTCAVMSWLYARANLRDLMIRAGSIPSRRSGEMVSVPVELRHERGRAPCGLEVSSPDASTAVHIPELAADRSTNLTLRLQTRDAGTQENLQVVVRSLYPLGIFTAQRVIEVPVRQTVRPRAAGDLPLPAAEAHGAGKESHALSTTGHRGDGGDFAGVRPWQAGDPLRHVDWKAVARGRPMMVKRWAADSDEVTWLDWGTLDLPPAERASQLAKWMDECVTQERVFGLRLPGKKIPPGVGEAHANRGLDALAEMVEQEKVMAVTSERRKDSQVPTLEQSARLSTTDLLLMAFALLLVTLTMWGDIAAPGFVALVGFIVLRFFFFKGQRDWIATLVRGACILAGLAAGFAVHRTFLGLEPGITAMLVMTGAKFSESRTPRDYQVLAVLGWFLCLCSLALDMTLSRTVAVLAGFLFTTYVLVRFRRRGGTVMPAVRVTFTMLAQALPVVLLLFLVFPRGATGLVGSLRRSMMAQSGVSEYLDPGGIARIALSDEVAFRVSFPEGGLPQQRERYWRCLTLWQGNGLSWTRGGSLRRTQPVAFGKRDFFKQKIMLEPHGQNWLVALDSPVSARTSKMDHILDHDATLWTDRPVTSLRQYEVTSTHPLTRLKPPNDHLEAALAVPRGVTGAVRALADQIIADADSDAERVEAVLRHFREQKFQYTIEPGTYAPGMDGLEEFLLRRRLGFCEHFSAAFATLMRLSGVPARVVIGYVGGELHEGGGYLIVRQSDAHAWTEVWLEDEGWKRIDPTAELAPGRLNMDLAAYLGGGDLGAVALERQTWWWQAFRETRLAWDHASYLWYQHVVRYDEDEQRGFLSSLGLPTLSTLALIGATVLFLLLGLIALWFWQKCGKRHRDPAVRLWLRLCDALAKHGTRRTPSEGPQTYAERAAAALPHAAGPIRAAAEGFVQVRYGEKVMSRESLATLVKAVLSALRRG